MNRMEYIEQNEENGMFTTEWKEQIKKYGIKKNTMKWTVWREKNE